MDSNFKAHIGDFGLARGGPEADQDHKTVSVIIGTDWYLPDDYRYVINFPNLKSFKSPALEF